MHRFNGTSARTFYPELLSLEDRTHPGDVLGLASAGMLLGWSATAMERSLLQSTFGPRSQTLNLSLVQSAEESQPSPRRAEKSSSPSRFAPEADGFQAATQERGAAFASSFTSVQVGMTEDSQWEGEWSKAVWEASPTQDFKPRPSGPSAGQGSSFTPRLMLSVFSAGSSGGYGHGRARSGSS